MRWFLVLSGIALIAAHQPRLDGAQEATDSERSFDAVSVKYSGPASFVQHGPGPGVAIQFQKFRYIGNRVTCDLTLQDIVKEAFSIDSNYRVSGPAWIGDEKFQVAAITPTGTPVEDARKMLQSMLRERFSMRYHWDRQARGAYSLHQAPGGIKLHPIDPALAKERIIETPAGTNRGGTAEWAGGFATVAITLPEFCANFLSKRMAAPVVDKTGAAGVFEIDLRWEAPDGYAPGNPDMLRAMEQKLGLRLEKEKLPIVILIIDRIERPTGN